tara:strand:- start:265 stop:393 length:129 start_codon:yes stop_codon:yes gene_type:complete
MIETGLMVVLILVWYNSNNWQQEVDKYKDIDISKYMNSPEKV